MDVEFYPAVKGCDARTDGVETDRTRPASAKGQAEMLGYEVAWSPRRNLATALRNIDGPRGAVRSGLICCYRFHFKLTHDGPVQRPPHITVTAHVRAALVMRGIASSLA